MSDKTIENKGSKKIIIVLLLIVIILSGSYYFYINKNKNKISDENGSAISGYILSEGAEKFFETNL